MLLLCFSACCWPPHRVLGEDAVASGCLIPGAPFWTHRRASWVPPHFSPRPWLVDEGMWIC